MHPGKWLLAMHLEHPERLVEPAAMGKCRVCPSVLGVDVARLHGTRSEPLLAKKKKLGAGLPTAQAHRNQKPLPSAPRSNFAFAVTESY